MGVTTQRSVGFYHGWLCPQLGLCFVPFREEQCETKSNPESVQHELPLWLHQVRADGARTSARLATTGTLTQVALPGSHSVASSIPHVSKYILRSFALAAASLPELTYTELKPPLLVACSFYEHLL